MRRESLLDVPAGQMPVRAWLVFTSGERNHWWHWFLDPRFHHVYALLLRRGTWIRFDAALDGTNVDVIDAPVYAMAQDLVEPGAIVLEVKRTRQTERMRAPWVVGPLTCVEAIKALLGIRRFFVWTPRQLYRHIGGRHHETTTRS